MIQIFDMEQGAAERYGRLTLVADRIGKTADGHIVSLWRCDCGRETKVASSRVRNGYTRSCGCLAVDVGRAANLVHGMRGTPEYSSWQAMKSRCLDPNNKDYARWGGRGVTVCPEWIDSFDAFYSHMGPRPSGTTLDRKDNLRGYEPGNVRWASATTQATNRSSTWTVEINGKRYASVEAAARAHGVSNTTIVRWCDGYTDARRTHHSNNGHKPARPGCRKWRKYAR